VMAIEMALISLLPAYLIVPAVLCAYAMKQVQGLIASQTRELRLLSSSRGG